MTSQSDTPRVNDCALYAGDIGDEVVRAEFARTLERELQARDKLINEVLVPALKQARHCIYYGGFQIGWNIDRIDEALLAAKGKV